MVLYIKLDAPVLTVVTDTGANAPTIRWCDYPGIRIAKKVSFEVNGNPLDSYTPECVLMHQGVSVQPGKEAGWNRCMGQQESMEGLLTAEETGAPGNSAVAVHVYNGPQTPLAAQTGLTLMIPLLFWCNKDPKSVIYY